MKCRSGNRAICGFSAFTSRAYRWPTREALPYPSRRRAATMISHPPLFGFCATSGDGRCALRSRYKYRHALHIDTCYRLELLAFDAFWRRLLRPTLGLERCKPLELYHWATCSFPYLRRSQALIRALGKIWKWEPGSLRAVSFYTPTLLNYTIPSLRIAGIPFSQNVYAFKCAL